MKLKTITTIALIFLLAACTNRDYEKGEELYSKEDYVHALHYWPTLPPKATKMPNSA